MRFRTILPVLAGFLAAMAVPLAAQNPDPGRYTHGAYTVPAFTTDAASKAPCFRFMAGKPADWPDAYTATSCIPVKLLGAAVGYGPLAGVVNGDEKFVAIPGQKFQAYAHAHKSGPPITVDADYRYALRNGPAVGPASFGAPRLAPGTRIASNDPRIEADHIMLEKLGIKDSLLTLLGFTVQRRVSQWDYYVNHPLPKVLGDAILSAAGAQ